MEYHSLEVMIRPHIDKAWEDLPEAVRKYARLAFHDGPMSMIQVGEVQHVHGNWWNAFSPEQRRKRAREWDADHDPAHEQERERTWGLIKRVHELEADIADWEGKLTPTALDKAAQEDAIANLRCELEEANSAFDSTNGQTDGRRQTRALNEASDLPKLESFAQQWLDKHGKPPRHGDIFANFETGHMGLSRDSLRELIPRLSVHLRNERGSGKQRT